MTRKRILRTKKLGTVYVTSGKVVEPTTVDIVAEANDLADATLISRAQRVNTADDFDDDDEDYSEDAEAPEVITSEQIADGAVTTVAARTTSGALSGLSAAFANLGQAIAGSVPRPAPPRARDYNVPALRDRRQVTDVYGLRAEIFTQCEEKGMQVIVWNNVNQLTVLVTIVDMTRRDVRGIRIWARHWRLQDIVTALNQVPSTLGFDDFVSRLRLRIDNLYRINETFRDSIEYQIVYDIGQANSVD
jgi:hypothetical protein